MGICRDRRSVALVSRLGEVEEVRHEALDLEQGDADPVQGVAGRLIFILHSVSMTGSRLGGAMPFRLVASARHPQCGSRLALMSWRSKCGCDGYVRRPAALATPQVA